MVWQKPDNFATTPGPRCELADGDGLLVRAPAKINLNLLVGPLRNDGFHPVDSVVTKITFYDALELLPRDDDAIRLFCDGADCGPSEKNLAWRAAVRLAEAACPDGGVDIRLHKNIPPGAGLGGGSSDAAATLWGLNELWGIGLDTSALTELATELGSDVPLFLGPPAARMTGRGEILTPTKVHNFTAVLILPGLHCPTGEVYRAFDVRPTESLSQLPLGVLADCPPSEWRSDLVNQLAPAAMTVCPPLEELWESIRSAVDVPVHVTGSGSAMFILCDDAASAEAVFERLPDLPHYRALIVRPNAW